MKTTSNLNLPTLLIALLATLPVQALAADVETPPSESVPSQPQTTDTKPTQPESMESSPKPEPLPEIPWDFSPYRVLVWVVADSARASSDAISPTLHEFLDRDFSSIWRVTIADAPMAVRAAASRDMDAMSYDMLTSADPVLAVKRDHKDAVRIRIASNVGEFVNTIYSTKNQIDGVIERGGQRGDSTLAGVDKRLKPIDGDASKVQDLWADANTEAILASRGMAVRLDNPEAKIVTLPIAGLVSETIEQYDKVFIVRATVDSMPGRIDVVELDTLMRYFGPIASSSIAANQPIGEAVGHAVIKAFAPVVRIDDAGQKTAVGLLRASGLIMDEDSPAMIHVDDVLQPMTRKNDRNGNPFMIGAMDWAYLAVTEYKDRNVSMDFYAGRAGGLQGRKNARTFRTALKVRPMEDETLLRLHAQGDVDFPLIGYEIYEKELKSTAMTFIGRTDWNGRLNIQKTDDPLRLMYVKNGGAVLARLPMVPGLHPTAVADLQGDDLRLQAEAYIRGVQDAIIDLVAVRELYKARIRMRLERGEMKEAEELMEALRNQPSNEALATDMGKKQAVFLKLLGTRNANQKRKVDEMFITTRELLSKHINPILVRDLEKDVLAAKKNGGKLPVKKPKDDEEES
ncbi:hypothetical protein [Rubripirellula reticaptiva]|uniref:Uncharacterized protein n=1 Tax=Rubripirellula reticaptiva TaxID=2528013 RepID=A0A5C6F7L3_9BACT|nr:hypothetical protein [Rubripirellula reticaptiva]TWU57225.1 hypothetical protein Poly59_01320 [Rubripirellula reticaptiva]